MRARLRISILGLVTLIVLMLSLLDVYNTLLRSFRDAGDRADALAEQMNALVIETVRRADPQNGPWKYALRTDPLLGRALEKALARSNAVVDVRVLDSDGAVLAAADRSRIGSIDTGPRSWSEWNRQPVFWRLADLFRSSQDLGVDAPIVAAGSADPILNVRVLLSPALLRAGIEPDLTSALAFSGIGLIVSGLLAFLVSRLVGDSLARLGHKIDLIAQGDLKSVGRDRFESPELIDLESKLWWLGRQYTGARSDMLQLRSNVEHVLRQLEEAVLVFGPDGRLQMAGEAAERLLARPRADLQDHTVDEVFPAWTQAGNLIQNAISHRQRLRNEPVTLDRANLPSLRLGVTVEPIEGAGCVIALREIDGRVEARGDLETANRLAALSRITSGVAHEIKNPLNAMMLHLEIARERLGEAPELEIVKRELIRLDRVVKSLLDFHRPVEIHMTRCELGSIASEVAALIGPQAESQRVRVSVEAEPQTIINGDCDLLKQAVLNVAVNSLEAMPASGLLRFRVSIQDAVCALAVEDDGPGIPADIHDKIFNLYFTTKQSGTGVGLAMTYRIVQLHAGSIRVESEPGNGARFVFEFPAAGTHQEVAA